MELKEATWNVRRATIYNGRFGEIVKECIERGWDIVCVSELNARVDGIKRYTHGGNRRYLVHSRKCGILMTENVFNVWEMQGKHWQPNNRLIISYSDECRTKKAFQYVKKCCRFFVLY